MKRLRYEDQGLDSTDSAILDALIENGRASVADLARKVGLTPPSVSERLKRLEEADVITGYSVLIDPAALGLPIAAWIRIRPLPGELKRVVTILQGLPEVVECDRITGEDCFIAKAHVRSVEDLEALLDEVIPFAVTNTSIIQSSPVKRRLRIVALKEGGAACSTVPRPMAAKPHPKPGPTPIRRWTRSRPIRVPSHSGRPRSATVVA